MRMGVPRAIVGSVWLVTALTAHSLAGPAGLSHGAGGHAPPATPGWDRLSAWVGMAVKDLTVRLGTDERAIDHYRIERTVFRDSALGAPVHPGERAVGRPVRGFTVRLGARGQQYEYRVGQRQLRLAGFRGRNHLVYPVSTLPPGPGGAGQILWVQRATARGHRHLTVELHGHTPSTNWAVTVVARIEGAVAHVRAVGQRTGGLVNYQYTPFSVRERLRNARSVRTVLVHQPDGQTLTVPIESGPTPAQPQLLSVDRADVGHTGRHVVVTIHGRLPSPGWRTSVTQRLAGHVLELHPHGQPPGRPMPQVLTAYQIRVQLEVGHRAARLVRVYRANGQPLTQLIRSHGHGPGHVLARRYDQRLVKPYRLLKEGYAKQNRSVYVVLVDLSADLRQPEVLATLEDVLLGYYQKRSDRSHSVQVQAFYKYPRSRAGTVVWTPGQAPQYTVTERSRRRRRRGTGEVIGDLLGDLLKKSK